MDGWMDGWMYKVGRDRRGLGSGGVRGLVVVFGGGCGGDWGGDEGWWRRVVEEGGGGGGGGSFLFEEIVWIELYCTYFNINLSPPASALNKQLRANRSY